MKATVEFEVNGCHDCVLCFTERSEMLEIFQRFETGRKRAKIN